MKGIIEEYRDVFPDDLPKVLPPSRMVDFEIHIIPGHAPPNQAPYRLSPKELEELHKQIEDLLEHGFIRESQSPYASPVLFVKKHDGTQRMCVDYRALNRITVKNRFPLPRIDDLLDQLGIAKYFSKLDLLKGYHQMLIPEKDRHKTAFKTRYGLFEYTVLPFGLCNAPSVFTQLMHSVLRPYLDKFVISYLDDILIYSKTAEEHKQHIRTILEALRQQKLYAKLSKCEFAKSQVGFLGHIISRTGVSMDPEKTQAITTWPTPKNVNDIERFLGLAGYYRRFVNQYSRISAPLNELKKHDVTWRWSEVEQQSFQTLKESITSAPCLIIPDMDKPFTVNTDASGFALGAALQQDHGDGLQPIAFWSRKMKPAETRYPVHEQELLAIVDALKHWKHYLHGSKFGVVAKTDHYTLQHFHKQPHLSARQARWSEFLQEYDFTIEYTKGANNVVADALSRRADHHDTQEEVTDVNDLPMDVHCNAVSTVTLGSLLEEIKAAYKEDKVCQHIINNPHQYNNEYHSKDGLAYKGTQLFIPNDRVLRNKLMQECHDIPVAGHLGTAKTIDRIVKHYYWPGQYEDIKRYVQSCHQCQINKPSQQASMGLLQPLEIPKWKWESVSMDLITALPKTKDGNDAIVVFVDRLTNWLTT